MTEQDKWDYINDLDEELLQGGVILSEWTTFLVKDAEMAFCVGANLASILACQAAIESHLRFDYFNSTESKNWETTEKQTKKLRMSKQIKNCNEIIISNLTHLVS